MSSSTETLKEAAALKAEGRTASAYSLLKTAYGWSVPECREALEQYAAKTLEQPTTNADKDQYIKEAMAHVELLDPLTVITLKKLRAEGYKISRSGVPDNALHQVRLILGAYEALVMDDINPARVIAAYLKEEKDCIYHRSLPSNEGSSTVSAVELATLTTLRDDLVDLL